MMERCTTLDDIPVVVYPDIIHLVLTTSSSVGGHRLIRHRRHQHHSTILGSQISQRFIKLMNYKHSGVNHPTTTAYCFFFFFFFLQPCYNIYILLHSHIGTTMDQKNDAATGEMIAAAGAPRLPNYILGGSLGGRSFSFHSLPFSANICWQE